MIEVEMEQSSGNIYADLGLAEADDMLIKARLASSINSIIKHRHLTQQQAAELLGIPQAKVSNLLRGNFRGISETKMLACLNMLGRDIEIVVRKSPRTHTTGRTKVLFA